MGLYMPYAFAADFYTTHHTAPAPSPFFGWVGKSVEGLVAGISLTRLVFLLFFSPLDFPTRGVSNVSRGGDKLLCGDLCGRTVHALNGCTVGS